MKIVVNYDLLKEIDDAENGVILKRVPKIVLASSIPGIAFIHWNYHYSLPVAAAGYALSAIYIISGVGFFKTVFRKIDDQLKEISRDNLKDLVIELQKLGLETTFELLLQAELLEKSTQVIEDGYGIKQDKYIVVPLKDGYEETIHQEHLLGTDEYELSVGSPQKKLVLKPIKNQ